jgi:Putative transposase
VLSRLFRRLFLEKLIAACQAGRLEFFADQAALAEPPIFRARLAALGKVEWVVYAKRPFGGPDAVLAYLSRYTHRIAIANSRLVAFDGERVTFKWKDYRARGAARYKLMTLDADEFIRRFLIHLLPDGFHRIRHYGFLASGNRTSSIALARQFRGMPEPASSSSDSDRTEGGHPDEHDKWNICLCCGGRMIIIETFEPGCQPRLWPLPSIGLDSSSPTDPVASSPCCPVPQRYPAGNADAQPMATVSAAFHRKCANPSAPQRGATPAKITVAPLIHLAFPFKNDHDSTPRIKSP